MARNPVVEARLQEWGEWVRNGDGAGYSARSVLDPDWTPGRGAGVMPMPSASGAPRMHELIGQLSHKQRAAVVAHYWMRLKPADQAEQLQCAIGTVYARIEAAHAELRRMLGFYAL
jgi:DNA-directed RNA polymerase specialized sigma24 family protein